MTSSSLPSIDAVEASHRAVAQEARVFLCVGAFLGMFPGGVSRASTDVAAGIVGSPLAVLHGV